MYRQYSYMHFNEAVIIYCLSPEFYNARWLYCVSNWMQRGAFKLETAQHLLLNCIPELCGLD